MTVHICWARRPAKLANDRKCDYWVKPGSENSPIQVVKGFWAVKRLARRLLDSGETEVYFRTKNGDLPAGFLLDLKDSKPSRYSRAQVFFLENGNLKRMFFRHPKGGRA